jgi:hypothetical protein
MEICDCLEPEFLGNCFEVGGRSQKSIPPGINRLRKNTVVRVEFVESTPQGLKPVLI